MRQWLSRCDLTEQTETGSPLASLLSKDASSTPASELLAFFEHHTSLTIAKNASLTSFSHPFLGTLLEAEKDQEWTDKDLDPESESFQCSSVRTVFFLPSCPSRVRSWPSIATRALLSVIHPSLHLPSHPVRDKKATCFPDSCLRP